MQRRIMLTFDDDQMAALKALAHRETRNPWQQAVLIILKELEKQGLISSAESPTFQQRAAKGGSSHAPCSHSFQNDTGRKPAQIKT
jgi:hypothetical protein